MDVNQYRTMMAEAQAALEKAKKSLDDAEAVIRFCRERISQFSQQTLPLRLERNLPDLSDKTVPEAVEVVLRASGKPLRAGEIAEALVTAGFEDKPHLSISVTSAIRRRDDLFKKVDRGLFALKNGENH